MKRLIAIFFVLIYTISVSGMVIQHHYCEGSLMASGIAGTVDDCCMVDESKKEDVCDMECCLNKADVVKVDAPQEKPASFKLIKIQGQTELVFTVYSFNSVIAEKTEVFSSEVLQPPKIPLNILYSVFRI